MATWVDVYPEALKIEHPVVEDRKHAFLLCEPGDVTWRVWLTADGARNVFSELGAALESKGLLPPRDVPEQSAEEALAEAVARINALEVEKESLTEQLLDKSRCIEEWRTKAEYRQEKLERRVATEDRRKPSDYTFQIKAGKMSTPRGDAGLRQFSRRQS